jgi:hypothetical protein
MDYYAGIFCSQSVNRASWALRLLQVSHRNNSGKTLMILQITQLERL